MLSAHLVVVGVLGIVDIAERALRHHGQTRLLHPGASLLDVVPGEVRQFGPVLGGFVIAAVHAVGGQRQVDGLLDHLLLAHDQRRTGPLRVVTARGEQQCAEFQFGIVEQFLGLRQVQPHQFGFGLLLG